MTEGRSKSSVHVGPEGPSWLFEKRLEQARQIILECKEAGCSTGELIARLGEQELAYPGHAKKRGRPEKADIERLAHFFWVDHWMDMGFGLYKACWLAAGDLYSEAIDRESKAQLMENDWRVVSETIKEKN